MGLCSDPAGTSLRLGSGWGKGPEASSPHTPGKVSAVWVSQCMLEEAVTQSGGVLSHPNTKCQRAVSGSELLPGLSGLLWHLQVLLLPLSAGSD